MTTNRLRLDRLVARIYANYNVASRVSIVRAKSSVAITTVHGGDTVAFVENAARQLGLRASVFADRVNGFLITVS